MALLKVGDLNTLSRDRGNCVTVEGLAIAVFYVETGWFAVENRCSHRDVSLDDGAVFNGEVICPLHGAKFDLKTGVHRNPPATTGLKTFLVTVVGDEVFVEV